MNEQAERRRRILKKLAKLVAELSLEFHDDDTPDQSAPAEMQSDTVAICTPKSLPDELQVNAARTAVRYNPLNAPRSLGALRNVHAGEEVLSPARIAVDVNRYWGPSQRTLTVSFLEQTAPALQKRILDHMNAWTKTAGISFQLVSQNGNVRITRAAAGFWSYTGTDILHIPPGQPTMSLQGFSMSTPESEYLRVVRHETGHTLGFPHEHLRRELVGRLNRQKCYEYFWRTQRWDRQKVDSQVLTPLDEMSIFATPPDETSIMCYQLPGEVTNDGRPIKGGSDINTTDYWFAGSIYPKAGAASSPEARLAALQEQMPAVAAQSGDGESSEDSGFLLEPLEL